MRPVSFSPQNLKHQVTEADKIKAAKSRFFTSMHAAFISQITQGNMRRGQAWMNALYTVSPSLYETISGSEWDCFYSDDLIPVFMGKVFGERTK